jgi:aryl-alcohol dehydrogenase-like predicted oxidoreductase
MEAAWNHGINFFDTAGKPAISSSKTLVGY